MNDTRRIEDIIEDYSNEALISKGLMKEVPLWYHLKGLSQTASGYGRKLTSRFMIKDKNRWKRVYVCQYSNAGTTYFVRNGEWVIVNL